MPSDSENTVTPDNLTSLACEPLCEPQPVGGLLPLRETDSPYSLRKEVGLAALLKATNQRS